MRAPGFEHNYPLIRAKPLSGTFPPQALINPYPEGRLQCQKGRGDEIPGQFEEGHVHLFWRGDGERAKGGAS